MRNLSTILLAVVMVFGLAQCKKEQPTPQGEGNVVTITLNVDGNNGSRVNVDPTGTNQVTFTDGDQILVASDGKYVGTLTKDGGMFSGTVSADDLVDGQPLYFYFLGNKQGELQTGVTTCTVNISDQTGYPNLPVISMGRSIDTQTGNIVKYASGMTSFSSRLYNKCSLMKFNVTTPSDAAICITGMNNQVTVNFGTNVFTYGQVNGGLIKMRGQAGSGEKTYWAIVLPKEDVTPVGVAYSEDNNYTGNCPEIDVIEVNKYYDSGIALSVSTHAWNVNSVYLRVNNAGDTYSDECGFTVTATENASWAGGDAGIRLATSEDKLTFESTVGNITKIEITTHSEYGEMVGTPSSGWEYSNHKLTWTGTPSSTVELGCVVSSKGIPGGGPGGGGDEPGIDPGGGGVVIIENAFELIFISQVQFTVQ